MHNIDLITTLTAGLGAALVFGYLTHRAGMSPIVGYLLAGVALGPNTPGFIANREIAEQLAEIGVILLMFGVGLHFHIKELLAVRRIAIPGAVGQSVVATALGLLAAVALGMDWRSGLVFGLAISVASTVVLVRVLGDNRDLHTPAGHIAVGWLVVEDIFTVVILILLPALFKNEQGGLGQLPAAIAVTILKIGLLVGVTVVIGGRIIPALLGHVAATRSRELFTLTVLAIALGIAVGSATLFGVSMALGAFLAGMVVGRSEFSVRAASEALPMRDAFAVLFFVSVGMLFNPGDLLGAPGLFAAALAIILIGKPLTALLIALFMGYPLRIALSVAIALAQIGEFSFLLAGVARELGILQPSATNALVAASIVSITLNPLLYMMVPSLDKRLASHPRLSAWLQSRMAREDAAGAGEARGHAGAQGARRAIVVGYGPTGQVLARLLQDNGIKPAIIELNLETLRSLRERGIEAHYGDANHAEALRQAGIEEADNFILSADMPNSQEAIRLARELNPDIRIFARSAYLRDLPALRQAGADAVFSGEREVAFAMTEAMLRQWGATPEQIDRERERVQASLGE